MSSVLSDVFTDVRSTPGGPTWEIAHLFPYQGTWSEAEYLALDTNHRIEFTDGCLEVLPMPTTSHHAILAYLYHALMEFVGPNRLGRVFFAGIRVRLRSDKYREPDLLFMAREHETRIGEQFWDCPDLVMEVVSPDDPDRDWIKKREDYAEAGIPEYWIVDPQRGVVTVLRLDAGRYVAHGEFPRGTRATSSLLPGLEIEVTAALAAR